MLSALNEAFPKVCYRSPLFLDDASIIVGPVIQAK